MSSYTKSRVMEKWWNDFEKSVLNGNSEEFVNFLSRLSVSQNYDSSQHTLLHWAAKSKIPDVVTTLLRVDGNVNAVNLCGQTPLHLAIKNYTDDCSRSSRSSSSSSAVIEILIQAGSNVNATDRISRTPLHYANGNSVVVKLLLDAGAKVNRVDCLKNTPLHLVSYDLEYEKYYTEGVRRLIEAGCNVNAAAYGGQTCLHRAATTLNFKLMELLLNNGASVDVVNDYDLDPLCCTFEGWRPFHFPNARTQDLLRLFDEDYVDTTTPLQIDNLFECLKLLIKHGANVNRVNKWNTTPFYLALAAVNHSKIIKLLLHHGAIFDFKDEVVRKRIKMSNNGKTPFLLLRHAAMQDQRNNTLNFNLKNLNKLQQELYAKSRDELELMKTSWIYGSMSITNVLVGSASRTYIRNENVASAFKKKQIEERFPIFCDLLTESFEKEQEKQVHITRAINGLQRILPWDENAMPEIFDKILYRLNINDLSALAII